MYIHSVYKESPRHYLSIEIKDHKFWKFKTHLYNHHFSKPGHITGRWVCTCWRSLAFSSCGVSLSFSLHWSLVCSASANCLCSWTVLYEEILQCVNLFSNFQITHFIYVFLMIFLCMQTCISSLPTFTYFSYKFEIHNAIHVAVLNLTDYKHMI